LGFARAYYEVSVSVAPGRLSIFRDFKEKSKQN
jgi:hypothetical protein